MGAKSGHQKVPETYFLSAPLDLYTETWLDRDLPGSVDAETHELPRQRKENV